MHQELPVHAECLHVQALFELMPRMCYNNIKLSREGKCYVGI